MIPLNLPLSSDYGVAQEQLITSYYELANGVNGRLEKWTPEVYGSTTTGAPTYLTQRGWCFVQGIMVDVWIAIYWNDVGGAAGNILMKLPVINSVSVVNPVVSTNLSLGAGYTGALLQIGDNTNVAQVLKSGSGVVSATLTFAVAGAGGLYGHIRYVGQRDLSRR